VSTDAGRAVDTAGGEPSAVETPAVATPSSAQATEAVEELQISPITTEAEAVEEIRDEAPPAVTTTEAAINESTES
jgi:hypothetical protein